MIKNLLLVVLTILILCAPATHADLNVSLPIGYSYSHVSALTTTVAKSGAGSLHSIIINSAGTAPCTVVIYDSTSASGTQVAALDCSSSKQFNYDVPLTTGLTVLTVSTATPSGAPDVTVTYQ